MKRVRPLLGNRLNLTNNKLVDVNLACRKFGFQILQDGEFIMYEGFLIIYFYFFLSFSLKLDNLELKAAEMKKKKTCMVDRSRVTYFRTLLLFNISLALRILCFRTI